MTKATHDLTRIEKTGSTMRFVVLNPHPGITEGEIARSLQLAGRRRIGNLVLLDGFDTPDYVPEGVPFAIYECETERTRDR